VCILDMRPQARWRSPDYAASRLVLPRAILLEPLLPNLDDLHGLIPEEGTRCATMLVHHLQILFREAPTLAWESAAAARGTRR